MGANDKNVLLGRLTQEAKDESRSPASRLLSLRKLLRKSNFSVRSIALAKRTAKEFLENKDATPEVRKSALSLLDKVYAGRDEEPDEDDNDVQEVLAGVHDPAPRGTRSAAVIVPGETREQALTRRNRHWNTQPVPCKFLMFYEPSDLAAFGIADPINDPRHVFVDVTDENKDGSPFGKLNPQSPNRVLNPSYLDAYRAWKTKRFPHGLPDRDSTWRVRYETRSFVNTCPELLRMWPAEFPVGEDLRTRERISGEVASWEEPFCHELYFEILLSHRGEFFVMFEIEGPDEAYFAAREREALPSRPNTEIAVEADLTPIRGREVPVVPRSELVCRVCENSTIEYPAAPHDCSIFMKPAITGMRGF
jgi:hypothetical protein